MQGTTETAAEYATRLQTLRRRHGQISATARLTRLYQNMRPEYRRYMKHTEFTTVQELLQLASKYEQLIARNSPRKGSTGQRSQATGSEIHQNCRTSTTGNFRIQLASVVGDIAKKDTLKRSVQIGG